MLSSRTAVVAAWGAAELIDADARPARALTHLKVTASARGCQPYTPLKLTLYKTLVLPAHAQGAAGAPGVPEETDGHRRPSTAFIGGGGAGRRRELRRRSANPINKLIKSASERSPACSRPAISSDSLSFPLIGISDSTAA